MISRHIYCIDSKLEQFGNRKAQWDTTEEAADPNSQELSLHSPSFQFFHLLGLAQTSFPKIESLQRILCIPCASHIITGIPKIHFPSLPSGIPLHHVTLVNPPILKLYTPNLCDTLFSWFSFYLYVSLLSLLLSLLRVVFPRATPSW